MGAPGAALSSRRPIPAPRYRQGVQSPCGAGGEGGTPGPRDTGAKETEAGHAGLPAGGSRVQTHSPHLKAPLPMGRKGGVGVAPPMVGTSSPCAARGGVGTVMQRTRDSRPAPWEAEGQSPAGGAPGAPAAVAAGAQDPKAPPRAWEAEVTWVCPGRCALRSGFLSLLVPERRSGGQRSDTRMEVTRGGQI